MSNSFRLFRPLKRDALEMWETPVTTANLYAWFVLSEDSMNDLNLIMNSWRKPSSYAWMTGLSYSSMRITAFVP